MFRIKICGIRGLDDERDAFRHGADAVGLNFYAKSRRFLDHAARRGFEQRPTQGPLRVGVFVNESTDIIRHLSNQCHLDAIQLHGDEPPEMVAELAPLPVIRAFRSSPACPETVRGFLQECTRLKCGLAAVLIDAAGGGSPGGTGQVADWTIARALHPLLGGVPLILAGGLRSDNVELAISSARPFGVDVASGVERNDMKDAVLIRHFVEAAYRGLGLPR